jgi:vancomycin resistance protein YoaR
MKKVLSNQEPLYFNRCCKGGSSLKGYKLSKGIIAAIIILLVMAGIAAAGAALLSGEQIRSNIFINGINVSGLSRNEAINRLKSIHDDKLGNSFISLKFEGKEWKMTYKDINYSYDIEQTVDRAYSVGHSGDIFKRLTETLRSKMEAQNFETKSTYDEQPIGKLIGEIAKQIDQEVVDATIKYKNGKFNVTEDRVGKKLNQEDTLALIKEKLHKVDVAVLDLPVDIVKPIVLKSDLLAIQDKLGEFSTKFNAADGDRTTNIKVATSSTSNVLIRPGEVYSVNETIGPRLAKFGYKEAKVIINNELVPGIGGGVCQVSSTLYNAVLLSNLKIIERQNHSLPLSYVSMGRDATISGDYIDFKFLNNTNYPIYIYGEVQGSWVKFTVFGKNQYPGRSVSIISQVLKTTPPKVQVIQDPNLPAGTEVVEKKAYTGYVVNTKRIVYENGKEIVRENLGNSTYRVVNGVKRVGTKGSDTGAILPEGNSIPEAPNTNGQAQNN